MFDEKRLCFTFVAILLTCADLFSQSIFTNPSFEGLPRENYPPPGWETDLTGCGERSTPDTQPGYWDCYLPPFDGDSYVGMVARTDDTSEGVYQRGITPFKTGYCYGFEIHLAKSSTYWLHPGSLSLEVWLGETGCQRIEKVWTSPVIDHEAWKPYEVAFIPKGNYDYIIFMAAGAGGNILIDAISKERVLPFSPPILQDTTVCRGVTVNLDATAGLSFDYQWSTGATTSSINVTEEGIYDVTISSGGCQVNVSQTLTVEDAPLVILPKDTTLFASSNSVVLNANVAGVHSVISWSTGASDRYIEVSESGTYWLTASNRCGVSVDSIHVVFVPLYIPNIVTYNGDGYNDTFIIQGLAPGTFHLKIFNRWGKLVYQTNRYFNDWPREAGTGVYYIEIRMNDSYNTFKGVLHVLSER